MRHLIQDKLTSGKNIKTINGQDILGAGDLSTSVNTFHTVTTTNNTITNLYTFTPSSDGVYLIEWMISGFESATGDTIGAKLFATFKVIAGVVTQVSTQTIDRKSNFPNIVTVTLNTDGTLIRARVTGRNASTIVWRGYLTITS
jgi:hypothetical protein